MKDKLLEKINNKNANIGIIGLGYVGLPLVMRYAEVGFATFGFDIDETKVNRLNEGRSYIKHIPDSEIALCVERGFSATTDFGKIKDMDALVICVPTPLTQHREPDLRFILSTMENLAPHLKKGQVVSLESTTYPGTTDEELKPFLDRAGLKVGEDVFLVYSPEREDPANPDFNTQTIPKVVGGYSPSCLAVGQALYQDVVDRVVPVSSTRAAEMTKLLENIHRAVNIGLVNEMKIVAHKMDIDIHEVIDAAATKPFGFTPYYPGPGLGGHCIPIDPFYLTWKAREYGVHTRFIELAGEVNASMPDYVVNKLVHALNLHGKAVKGSQILVLGIAYKKNVDDMRESPSVFIMEKLEALGATVAYSDPNVPSFPKMREHHFDLDSVSLTTENLQKYDAVILATNHDDFDYELIKSSARLIVDTRGIYQKPADNVVKA